ncbi:MAG: cation:proton antiporter [Pseudohongiella sp.]|nr:cation:proton antiporter [Pseudohongiella sp.]
MLTDPIIIYFVVCSFVALAFGLLMLLLKLPVFAGYILAGALLGPYGLGLFTDLVLINQLGSIGVVMLLFFIGVEVSPKELITKWRVALVGTLLQIGLSVGAVSLIGLMFDWPLARVILLGFVISLSCTAVVIDYLKTRGEADKPIAHNLLGILIMQDLFVVPMLVILGMLDGEGVAASTLWRQLVGSVLVLAVLIWEVKTEVVSNKFLDKLREQAEMQVFFALLLCFAFSFVTGYLHLSTALGAFIAGMLVGRMSDADWISSNLMSIKVVFVALFFASVGALLNPRFLIVNWQQILLLVMLIFVANTIINAGILKVLGIEKWESIYGGALLAHVGEFSFVLAAIGLNAGIVVETSYQLTVAVIALTLLLGPLWVNLVRKLIGNRLAKPT